MPNDTLRLHTHSRLSFGLIDTNGEIGRAEGGLGVTLESPCLKLRARRSTTVKVEGPAGVSEDALRKFKAIVQTFVDRYRVGGVHISIEESIPGHSGLGSGTQLALAFGQAINLLYDLKLTLPEIVRIAQRGGTSGIGCAAFETGGFIADGGHRFGGTDGKQAFAPSSASTAFDAPPILFQSNLPASWPFVRALPAAGLIPGGKEERALSQKHCPTPAAEAAQTARLALLKVLPAIMEADLPSFGAGIEAMQCFGLKRIQIARQSAAVRATMDEMRRLGLRGVGMSSWGPALFGFTDCGLDEAQATARALETFGASIGGVRVILTRAATRGATWTWE